MRRKSKNIVIYGGAFNPPHAGHAIAIETCMRLFPCDELWILPSADRKDKRIGVTGKERIAMLRIMVKEFFSKTLLPIKISTLEIDRPKLSTTFDTKQELEKTYPDHEFHFLIGSELIHDIKKKWIKGKKLYTSTNFIVIKRFPKPLSKPLPPHLTILDNESFWLNVSSTFVRQLIANGHSGVPYFTPRVARYIRKHKLYRT